MYRKLSLYITNKMIKNNIVENINAEIYAFGFELLISYFVWFLLILIVAFITNTILETILFCGGFMILRRFAGGYHTSTYLRCQILFLLNQLLFVCLIKTLEESIYFGISLFLACMSVLIIWLIAPIDHENRRFNENEYCYFKTMSRMYSLVIIISFIIMSVFPKTRLLLLSHLLGVFLASCSVLVAFVQKKLKK